MTEEEVLARISEIKMEISMLRVDPVIKAWLEARTTSLEKTEKDPYYLAYELSQAL